MKIFISRIICLLLTVIMCFSLVACQGVISNTATTETESEKGDSSLIPPSTPVTDPDSEYVATARENKNVIDEVKNTKKIFYSNGQSDYKILIPQGKSGKFYAEGYAALELQYFVSDASGITLPIVEDVDLTLDSNSKYISFGDTSLYAQSSMVGTLNNLILGNDGYKILTYGNAVIFNSYGENGMLYSAYGFLRRVLNLRYYAEDCWTLTSKDTVYLKDMNVQDVPDFNQRWINTGVSDATYVTRLREHCYYSNSIAPGEGSGWLGNDMSIADQAINYLEYQPTHPSWYWNDGGPYSGQPCLTALYHNYIGDEIYESDTETLYSPSTGKRAKYNEYVGEEYNIHTGIGALSTYMRNVIYNWISPSKNARIYMIGANDNPTPCGCRRCKEEINEFKASGQYVIFANTVAKKYEEWQRNLTEGDEYYDQKNRVMQFAFFAYQHCEASPTVYDAATDSYAPINANMICRDDVVVRIAPIYSYNMYLHSDKDVNPGSAAAFESWGVCAENFAIWDYGCNFVDAVVPYPDWGTLKENFLMYRRIGVHELFTQLQSRTSGYGLRAYKMFIRAELMWNIDLDYYQLTKDFFMNYYGEDAGPILINYLNFLQAKWQTFAVNNMDKGYIYWEKASDVSTWSFVQTMNLGNFFTDAINSIEHLKASNPDLHEKYYTRIKCESLFYLYLRLKNYSSYMTAEEGNVIADEFEHYRKIAGLRLRRIKGEATFDGWVDEQRKNFITI